jgi:hypothetical protein
MASLHAALVTPLIGPLAPFGLDPLSGLQSGHQILIVEWRHGIRRVVWPPEQAECPLLLPQCC